MQVQNEEPKGMSSIRVSHDVKKKIAKIAARLTLKDGNTRSADDILKLLIEAYEEKETSKK